MSEIILIGALGGNRVDYLTLSMPYAKIVVEEITQYEDDRSVILAYRNTKAKYGLLNSPLMSLDEYAQDQWPEAQTRYLYHRAEKVWYVKFGNKKPVRLKDNP